MIHDFHLITCKSMKTIHLISIIPLLWAGCSYSPILESPRIRSGVIVEAQAVHSQYKIKWHLSDSVMRNSIYSNEIENTFGSEKVDAAPVVKFAIANRVEFGGYFWTALLQNLGWDARLKIALFDLGKPVMFRNIGLALLMGSDGCNGEWDHNIRIWAGLTLGTLHKFGKMEIEYILMPTFGRNSFSNLDDGIGSGEVIFTNFDLTTGISLNFNERLFSSAAVSFSKAFNDHTTIDNHSSSTQIEEISYKPPMPGFNFVIGYRFGSRKTSSDSNFSE